MAREGVAEGRVVAEASRETEGVQMAAGSAAAWAAAASMVVEHSVVAGLAAKVSMVAAGAVALEVRVGAVAAVASWAVARAAVAEPWTSSEHSPPLVRAAVEAAATRGWRPSSSLAARERD